MKLKTVELPRGSRTLEDLIMVNHLLNDEVFKASIEESIGTIEKMYVDWKKDLMVYELMGGDIKYSVLSKIVKMLKEINYMKSFDQ